MRSTPASPRSRISSNLGSPTTCQYAHDAIPWHSHSRRSSNTFVFSVSTPRPPSSGGSRGDFGFRPDLAIAGLDPNEFGSLADELDEGWDDDAEETNAAEMVQQSEPELEAATVDMPTIHSNDSEGKRNGRDPGSVVADIHHHASRDWVGNFHRQRPSQRHYDGSGYGNGSDLESVEEISPSLELRMAAIESLARRGRETDESLQEDAHQRVGVQLRDLSSQADVEGHAARLITVCMSLNSHISNQSRILSSLIHPLISPLSLPPSPGTIDELLPLISSLMTLLPTPPVTTVPALRSLSNQTSDVVSNLSTLSDTLYMVRQTSTSASRRLRATKDIVETLRKELDEAEEGRQWLDHGKWDERLKQREAATVCRDVVGGFEKVCESWRNRLVRQGNDPGWAGAVHVATGQQTA